MMIKRNLVLNFCIGGMMLFLCLDVYSQTVAGKTINASELKYEEIRALFVGDKVPDIVIENIINYRNSATRISEFKGKLIIIDFWGTTCSSCIAALPKIDSLQKVYKDQVQVFTVTNYDTKEKVVETLKRYKKTQNLSLPVVLNDVKLKKYFPHEMVSHVVWIDGNGVVKAITGTEYITVRNITTVLDGKEVSWPVKNDVIDFDYGKPLLNFSQNKVSIPDFIYYSTLTGHMNGIDGTTRQIVDSSNNIVTYNAFNVQLLQLCNGAVSGTYGGTINPKHLVLNVKDKARYIFDKSITYYSEWAAKHTYCYSMQLPLNKTRLEVRNIIRNDLTHWLKVLGITVKKELRLAKCIVLVSNRIDYDLIQSRNSKEYRLEIESKVKRFQNTTFNEFLGQLNENTPAIPWVLNETNIPGDLRIDLTLHISSFEDLIALRKALLRYGIDLIETEREIEVYVITEDGCEE